jgi:hypothetical protein
VGTEKEDVVVGGGGLAATGGFVDGIGGAPVGAAGFGTGGRGTGAGGGEEDANEIPKRAAHVFYSNAIRSNHLESLLKFKIYEHRQRFRRPGAILIFDTP